MCSNKVNSAMRVNYNCINMCMVYGLHDAIFKVQYTVRVKMINIFLIETLVGFPSACFHFTFTAINSILSIGMEHMQLIYKLFAE